MKIKKLSSDWQIRAQQEGRTSILLQHVHSTNSKIHRELTIFKALKIEVKSSGHFYDEILNFYL